MTFAGGGYPGSVGGGGGYGGYGGYGGKQWTNGNETI